MFVARRLLDVGDLLVHITFHAAAERGIKLRQITNLHEIANRGSGFAIRKLGCVLAQVSFGFDRGGAARARRSNCLPIYSVGHVAGDENSRMLAFGQVPNE